VGGLAVRGLLGRLSDLGEEDGAAGCGRAERACHACTALLGRAIYSSQRAAGAARGAWEWEWEG
jgi:hypothetical protein